MRFSLDISSVVWYAEISARLDRRRAAKKVNKKNSHFCEFCDLFGVHQCCGVQFNLNFSTVY